MASGNRSFGSGKGCESCRRVDVGIGIIIQRQRTEIFPCKDILDIGLCIDQIERLLVEAVAWSAIDIAGFFTVRTFLDRLKIIFRESECFHENFLSGAEIFQFRF